mmetsp:Transcript_42607/g.72672  ORF Transcript_42607/g.72672 Transcript_42607/m.72672 type:complete len:178 (+) Transcript_42607:59-592(+)
MHPGQRRRCFFFSGDRTSSTTRRVKQPRWDTGEPNKNKQHKHTESAAPRIAGEKQSNSTTTTGTTDGRKHTKELALGTEKRQGNKEPTGTTSAGTTIKLKETGHQRTGWHSQRGDNIQIERGRATQNRMAQPAPGTTTMTTQNRVTSSPPGTGLLHLVFQMLVESREWSPPYSYAVG